MDVIGAHVVELMPSVDSLNGATTQNAVRIGFELIGLIADSIRGRLS